jgi:type VI secretion system protein ImpJ
MLLSPHHFQQSDRYISSEIGFRHSMLRPHMWGVHQIEFDPQALKNGRFTLLSLDAVLREGTSIRVPSIDPVPPSRDLTKWFTPDRPQLDVFVALPEERAGLPRVRMPGENSSSTESRFTAEPAQITDENLPESEAEVIVARQNLRILVSGENLDGFSALKIARLERSEEGVIIASPSFAPASLSLQAAGPVPAILRVILEILSAKSTALSSQTRQVGATVQFGGSDVILFWQLHTVNAFIPVLAHYQKNLETHPEELYLDLAQLAGALCTFAADRHPREVPAYEHEDLGKTFRALERIVRDLGEISSPTRFDRIPLKRVDDSLLKGDVGDERLVAAGAQWYLSVAGDLPEEKIREGLPAKITIGSTHNIEFLVRQALRGVAITYTAVPPRDFPLKAGHCYFRVENQGETWETIVESRSIAIVLRGSELKSLSFELLVMRP